MLAEKTQLGGPLPAGAVRAVVRDVFGRDVEATCADGRWSAEFESLTPWVAPPVRFFDERGQYVRRALPAGWPREVSDATGPCPSCEHDGWELVTAADGSRGRVDDEPAPLLVCTRCGHEEDGAGPVMYGGPGSEADEERVVAWREEQRELVRRVLAAAPFRPVGVAGEARHAVGGYSTDGASLHSISIGYGAVSVHTEKPGPHARDVLRDQLLHSLDGRPWPEGLSHASLTLWLERSDRERAARVAAAVPAAVRLPLDDQPRDFEGARIDALWAATATTEAARVTVVAQDREPRTLALRALAPEEIELWAH